MGTLDFPEGAEVPDGSSVASANSINMEGKATRAVLGHQKNFLAIPDKNRGWGSTKTLFPAMKWK